jgi:nickel-dependent lactate racemase
VLAGKGFPDRLLTDREIRGLLARALVQADLAGRRVLVIIPDGTRSGPISLFFRLFHELLWAQVAALDFLVALGTHSPMTQEAIHRRIGVSAEEMAGCYAGTRVYNHLWGHPGTFRVLGVIPASEIERLSEGRLSLDVPVALNGMILDYDQLVICGPVFPHEVVGFSGGNKYFIPGISGPAMIDVTHWLGALITSSQIIGVKHTPVRALIDRAAALIERPKLCCSLVVRNGGLAGLFVGRPEESWSQAADLSAQVHVRYVDRPYNQVLSVMPDMYDDLWTAAKGMYKLEPVVADGGEMILYAPHVSEFSASHGNLIEHVGYHVRDHFLKQWDRFKDYPWRVLAHSTHLRGTGTYEDGVEHPRIRVTLATGIPRERCERVNLGYQDPGTIDPREWVGREEEGMLLVPHAGEMLYRRRQRE